MYKTLSGREPAEAVLAEAKTSIAKLGRRPKLVIVQVGDEPASTTYVGNKLKKADAAGITAELRKLPGSASEKELLDIVGKLNDDATVDGFIVQLPLPGHMDPDKVIDAIAQEKDVDGFTSANMGRLFLGMRADLLPATPVGVMKMLDFYNVPIEGSHAVVVGRSNIVGKPVAMMLLNRNATVTLCHSRTRDLASHTLQADILVVAVGKPGLITAGMVKEGASVIDVGTTRVNGKTTGDVDFPSVIKKANCSPVPGGVGLMTTSMLMHNLAAAAQRRGKP